jgi:hypothetical protein
MSDRHPCSNELLVEMAKAKTFPRKIATTINLYDPKLYLFKQEQAMVA